MKKRIIDRKKQSPQVGLRFKAASSFYTQPRAFIASVIRFNEMM